MSKILFSSTNTGSSSPLHHNQQQYYNYDYDILQHQSPFQIVVDQDTAVFTFKTKLSS